MRVSNNALSELLWRSFNKDESPEPPKSECFTPYPSHYGTKGVDDLITVQSDSADDIIRQCNSGADESVKKAIKVETNTFHLHNKLQKTNDANNHVLQSVKRGHAFDGDTMTTSSAIQWSRDCSKHATDNGYLIYKMKISFHNMGPDMTLEQIIKHVKNYEPINKLIGTSHSITLGVVHWDEELGQLVVRKLKPEEIGVIGEDPKPEHKVRVEWRIQCWTHSDSRSFQLERIDTLVARSNQQGEVNLCINLDYTGNSRPDNMYYVHAPAVLFVEPVAQFGSNVGNLAYTEKGVGANYYPIHRLPHQNNHVLPLLNDLRKKLNKTKKAAAKAAAASRRHVSSDSQPAVAERQSSSRHVSSDSQPAVAERQSSSRRVSSDSQPAVAERQSSSHHVSSDSQPAVAESQSSSGSESQLPAHLEGFSIRDQLESYFIEHGESIIDKYGLFWITGKDIDANSFYCSPRLVGYYNYIMGWSRDLRSLYSSSLDLTDDEDLDYLEGMEIYLRDEAWRIRALSVKNTYMEEATSNSDGHLKRSYSSLSISSEEGSSDSDSD
eukprot:scaffold973_cov115-Skeletonema_dohrnii-CCMP3373.AAC.8